MTKDLKDGILPVRIYAMEYNGDGMWWTKQNPPDMEPLTEYIRADLALCTPAIADGVLDELHELVPATPLHEDMTRDIVADVKRLLARRAIADGVGVSGKATMTLNLSVKEMDALTEMAKAKDMSKTAVMRQALRIYQLVDIKMMEGKRMIWLKPDGTEEETIPLMAPDCTPPQAATDEGV